MPVDIDGLSLDELIQLNHRVVERIKMLQAMQAHVDMMAFNLGARVNFDSQFGRQFGTVVKYHRKTVTVLGDDGRQWRISPSLLSPVKDVDVPSIPGNQTKAASKNDCADSVRVYSGLD